MTTCTKHFWTGGGDERCGQCEADADDMRRKPTPPAVREFRVTTVVGDPSVELCNLLSQIMSSYNTIDAVERNAVVCWFRARYRVM